MALDTAVSPHQHHPQVVRRNFICHCLEGGLYMGGVAFLQPETVMPKMVEQLGGRSACSYAQIDESVFVSTPFLLPRRESAGACLVPVRCVLP